MTSEFRQFSLVYVKYDLNLHNSSNKKLIINVCNNNKLLITWFKSNKNKYNIHILFFFLEFLVPFVRNPSCSRRP